MKKITLLCVLFVTLTHSYASIPEKVKKINLIGNFHEMGQQYADKLNDELLLQYELNKHDLYPQDPIKKKQFEHVVAQFVEIAKHRYPKSLLEFIQGEADSEFAKVHNLTLNDFVFLDQQLFLVVIAREINNKSVGLDACSFVGAKSKAITIGRNFDYPRPYMRMATSYPIVLSMKHSDEKRYPNKVTMITRPGVISEATYANDRGHYISINLGASVGMDFKVIRRQSYLNGMLMMMLKAQEFDDLKFWVMQTAPDFGYLVNIAGPGQNDLYSIEASPYNELQGHYTPETIPADVFKTNLRKPNSSYTIESAIDNNEDYLVAANTFRLLGWQKILGHDFSQQTPTFSYQRYHNLSQIMHAQSGFDADKLKEIMAYELNTNQSVQGATANYCGSDPIYKTDPNASYWTVVFDTAKRELAVRFQQTQDDPLRTESVCHSTWSKWFSVSTK